MNVFIVVFLLLLIPQRVFSRFHSGIFPLRKSQLQNLYLIVIDNVQTVKKSSPAFDVAGCEVEWLVEVLL